MTRPSQKPPREIAKKLDQASIKWAGKIFWDKEFQKLAKFESLDQLEKDRIFNELIIAPLVVLRIMLEAPDLHGTKEFRNFLANVGQEIFSTHVAYLKGLGIEKKFLTDWEKLMEMRYEEYSQDKVSARDAMMEDKSKEKTLEVSDMEGINIFLPPFTVAVGCHHHICRSKTEGRDDLFKYLIKHLTRFYTQYRMQAEGGNIPLFLKARMSTRHFVNDIKDKLGIER
jgi:hypothetical protein